MADPSPLAVPRPLSEDELSVRQWAGEDDFERWTFEESHVEQIKGSAYAAGAAAALALLDDAQAVSAVSLAFTTADGSDADAKTRAALIELGQYMRAVLRAEAAEVAAIAAATPVEDAHTPLVEAQAPEGADGEESGFAVASPRRTWDGKPLTPGVNVDRVDIAAGIARARVLGYDEPTHDMVITYALQRHARGEEDGAVRTALCPEGLGNDLTSWYAILAAAVVAADAAAAEPVPAGQPVG